MDKVVKKSLAALLKKLKPMIYKKVLETVTNKLTSQKIIYTLSSKFIYECIKNLFDTIFSDDALEVSKEISTGLMKEVGNWKCSLVSLAITSFCQLASIASLTNKTCNRFITSLENGKENNNTNSNIDLNDVC